MADSIGAFDRLQEQRQGLPEGLSIREGIGASLEIVDAQEIVWVDFGTVARIADREDPIEWLVAVVECTCAGLGVTEAFDAEGEQVGIAELVERIFNEVEAAADDEDEPTGDVFQPCPLPVRKGNGPAAWEACVLPKGHAGDCTDDPTAIVDATHDVEAAHNDDEQ